MEMFDPLLDNLNRKINSCGGKKVIIPQRFRENFSNKHPAVIRSWLWDVPGFRRWRVTRMDAGDKLQVLNSVAYPDFVNDMPILGIDLLWFGLKGKLVAILDFQPLIQDQEYFDMYFDDLKLLKKNSPEFANENSMHSYDINNYFSPWVLFCRGDISNMNNDLPGIFERFINFYFDLYEKSLINSSKLTSNEVRKRHINYDIYNAERDPAHGLFKSYFGKDWSDAFLADFLFPFMHFANNQEKI